MIDSANGDGSLHPELAAMSPGLATDRLGAAFELKFQLNAAEAAFVEAWARHNLLPDCHGQDGFYRVTSVYCDTPRFDVFHRSAGFKRRKYRVRRYGDAAHVFLERKTKNGDQVRKKRVQIAADELTHLTEARILPDWAGTWFHQRVLKRDLRPTVRVSYERTAFVKQIGDTTVRMTLDRNLLGATTNEWTVAPLREGQPLLEGAALLEMKYHITLPDLFRDLLPQLPPQPARMSKYRRCVHLCGLAEPIILPGPHELRWAAS